MIGYVFAHGGATVLALAPAADGAEEYVVLAEIDGEYAVAYVPLEMMPSPLHWPWATYFTDRVEATASFREKSGLMAPLDLILDQVAAAQRRFTATGLTEAQERHRT